MRVSAWLVKKALAAGALAVRGPDDYPDADGWFYAIFPIAFERSRAQEDALQAFTTARRTEGFTVVVYTDESNLHIAWR